MNFLQKLFSTSSKGAKEQSSTNSISQKKNRIIASDYLKKSGAISKEVLEEDSLEQYNELLKDPKTDDFYEHLIKDFFIPFKISVLKYMLNRDYFKKPYADDLDDNYNYIAPSLKYIKKNKSTYYLSGYPNWFYLAFPDVILWILKGEGKKHIKNELGSFTEAHKIDEQKKSDYLKRYVQLYLENSNKTLECEIYK